jgi:hypothetical protein
MSTLPGNRPDYRKQPDDPLRTYGVSHLASREAVAGVPGKDSSRDCDRMVVIAMQSKQAKRYCRIDDKPIDTAVGINSVERYLGDEAIRGGWPVFASGAPRRRGADGQAGAGGRREAIWPVRRLPPHPAYRRGRPGLPGHPGRTRLDQHLLKRGVRVGDDSRERALPLSRRRQTAQLPDSRGRYAVPSDVLLPAAHLYLDATFLLSAGDMEVGRLGPRWDLTQDSHTWPH